MWKIMTSNRRNLTSLDILKAEIELELVGVRGRIKNKEGKRKS